MDLTALTAEPWPDYGLIDCGHGRKLERYGLYRFIRPEPQALWTPASSDWQADGEFVGGSDEDGGGRWHLTPTVPPSWPLAYGPVRFAASNTPFRHLGFFPDMACHWDWMAARCAGGASVLNGFGYTGVGSLVCAAAGASVTHLDASKKAVSAAAENQRLSGLADAPIRWVVDDALKFLRREVRRGRRYDGIILDPPKYGRGPDSEVWELYRDLPELMALARALLDERSRFLVLTVYAIRLSAVAIAELAAEALGGLGGRITAGEMTIREEARGRLLPTAIFVRWERD
ncbi:MAG: class I SAM-dependent methyltransferase [Sphingomonadaceae bacterium]|nr:class I SAM-dependent methyltransferase [Sphingomonadaceae bacterium]